MAQLPYDTRTRMTGGWGDMTTGGFPPPPQPMGQQLPYMPGKVGGGTLTSTGPTLLPMSGQYPQPTGLPDFPVYQPYGKQIPEMTLPGTPKEQPYPGMTQMPLYGPTREPYPITQLPTYQPTGEAYPGYRAPGGAAVSEELMASIQARMAGEGTAGAESAIYERGEERVERQYEEGLKRIDEEMSARGLTGSGIHGEAVRKLEVERQRSLADLSRQITIYGQQAIESAMGKAAQYVEYQSAEAARELAARERGWAGRVGERIRGFESKAKAAQAKGASEQAAYNTAIAERIRAYESQAKAAQAKTTFSERKWAAKADESMGLYRMEMEKAGMLQQGRMQAWQLGQAEYQRVFEATYRSTMDRYQAELEAQRAAERKAQFEWEKTKLEIEDRGKVVSWEAWQKAKETGEPYYFDQSHWMTPEGMEHYRSYSMGGG